MQISMHHQIGTPKLSSSNQLSRNSQPTGQIILTQFKSVIKDLFVALEGNDSERVDLRKVQLLELWKEFYADFIACDDNLFVEVATMVSLAEINPENRSNARSEYSKILKHILGSDSLLLSDYYVALAVAYDNEGFLDQALEYAGRALLIRVERNGVIHHKTAESHFILGSFYLKQQLFEEAKRELYSSRGIYCQLYDEKNVFVANCDFILGQIEQEIFHFDRAYLCYYKSFFTRCLLFGPQHQLTKLAENLAIACRQGSGGSGAMGAGVRWFCGVELKNRVRELQWNETNQTSCKYIITLFISRLHDDTILTSDQLLALLSTALKFYEANFAAVSQSIAHSQSKSIAPTTPEEVMMILSVPTRPLSVTPSREEKTRWEVTPEETVTPVSKQPDTLPVEDNVDNSIPSSMKNETKSTKSEGLTISTQPVITSVSKSKVTFSSESKTASSSSTPRESSSKVTHAHSGNESRIKAAAPITSPKLAIPQTWRPIPINSPLRNGGKGGTSFQSEKFHTLLNSATTGPRFVRNEKGDLLMLKKCSMDLLMSYFRPKMLLFALFSWYTKGSIRHLKRVADKRSSTVASSSPAIGGAIGAIAGDPKAALNALFSKRQAPAGSSDKTDAVVSSNQDSTTAGNGRFAASCPRPPPLPKSWPPIPYESEGDFGIGSGSDKMDLARALSGAAGLSKPKYKLLHMLGLTEIEGTFWQESPELSVPFEELFDDFEDEFNVTAKKKKSSVGKAPAAKSPKKIAQETVLDPQRAQNISIMLAKFGKRTVDSIAGAIIDFDPASLGGGAISSLVQFIPTPEEVGKVEQFLKGKAVAKAISPSPDEQNPSASPTPNVDGSSSKLGKAESYVLIMSKIPKLEKKLLLMSQILCSKETSQSIISGGEALVAAVQEVKGSGRLKFILRSFLDLNNSVLKSNQNSNLLQGISLTAWRKLGQVKINSGETAQNYVIGKLLQHVPEALEIAHDFPSIDEARGVNLPRLSAELKKIDESIALLQELIEDENKIFPAPSHEVETSQSKALGNLTRFQQELSKYHEEAKKRLDLALSDFSEVCRYYGESYPPMDPELFFGEVSSLVRAIQAVTANSSSKNRRKAVAT